MDKRIAERFLFGLIIILVAACAKVSSPSGGKRDRIPPAVVESTPVNGAVNFSGQEVVIEFNEFLTLDNINEKFMVSPPMKRKPKVFLRGKSVHIEYEDKLKDSTTYTFYFLDAIRDLNEGNIIDNYQFVFSTGSYIDSLSVTGNAYNSLNLEVPEKSTVLMYSDLSDSAVIKDIPSYLSRIEPNGYFRIDNVREGTYRLYAIKDDDNSKNYNRIEEPFAFIDSVITVTPEHNYIPYPPDTAGVTKALLKPEDLPVLTGEHTLIMFTGLKKSHYLLKSSRDLKYKLLFILSMPPDTMKTQIAIPDADSTHYMVERSRNDDTISVWLTDSILYNQKQILTLFTFPFTDTLGITGYQTDSIRMNFTQPRGKSTKTPRPKLTVGNNISGSNLKPGRKLVFHSETPLKDPDTTRIRLYELEEKGRKSLKFNFQRDSMTLTRLTLDADLSEDKQYLFIADSASFSNIFGEVADSSAIRFSVKPAESYSKLIMNMKNVSGTCIIQLLTKEEKLVSQKKTDKDGKLEFPLLDPGTYRLRAIYDLNGDGQWTTGDFILHRQPEPVTYYRDELEIKEGWEVNQDWDLKVVNLKEQKLRQKPKS